MFYHSVSHRSCRIGVLTPADGCGYIDSLVYRFVARSLAFAWRVCASVCLSCIYRRRMETDSKDSRLRLKTVCRNGEHPRRQDVERTNSGERLRCIRNQAKKTAADASIHHEDVLTVGQPDQLIEQCIVYHRIENVAKAGRQKIYFLLCYRIGSPQRAKALSSILRFRVKIVYRLRCADFTAYVWLILQVQ